MIERVQMYSSYNCVTGIRNFGKDFQAIADIIGTKTKAHVKTFYINNRKRYNLDLLLQDHEKEYGPVVDGDATDVKLDKVRTSWWLEIEENVNASVKKSDSFSWSQFYTSYFQFR